MLLTTTGASLLVGPFKLGNVCSNLDSLIAGWFYLYGGYMKDMWNIIVLRVRATQKDKLREVSHPPIPADPVPVLFPHLYPSPVVLVYLSCMFCTNRQIHVYLLIDSSLSFVLFFFT